MQPKLELKLRLQRRRQHYKLVFFSSNVGSKVSTVVMTHLVMPQPAAMHRTEQPALIANFKQQHGCQGKVAVAVVLLLIHFCVWTHNHPILHMGSVPF